MPISQPSWTKKLKLPWLGAVGSTSDLHLVASFDGDDFRYLMTRSVGPGMPPMVMRWGTEPRNEQTETQWLERIARLGLRAGRTTAVLAPHEYQVLQIDVPAVAESELKSATRWKIKDAVNAPPEDLTIDIMRMGKAGASRMGNQMWVIVSRNELVRLTMLRFTAARLVLEAIDIPEAGLRNLASRQAPAMSAVATLVEFHGEFLFSVCSGGELLTLRRIPGESGDEVSLRVVGEVQRSMDRFERQFPDTPLQGLLVDMGVLTDDYLRVLGSETQIYCEALGLSSALSFSPHEMVNTDLPSSFLPLCGASLRLPASKIAKA